MIKIEITKWGYIITVTLNSKQYTEVWEANINGTQRVEGDFENEEGIPDEIYDAIQNLSGYDGMKALQSII